MQRFDVRAEANILGRKTSGTNDKFLRGKNAPSFRKKFDRSGPGKVFQGDGHESKRFSVRLRKKTNYAVIPFRRSGVRAASETQGVAEVRSLGSYCALLRRG